MLIRCRGIHLLDADGRVVKTLKEYVTISRLDYRFRTEYKKDIESIGDVLLELQRDEVATVHYFVLVDQEYSSSEDGWSMSSITVLIVPSKQALLDWSVLYKHERDSLANASETIPT